jgi:ribonucleoside-triphosphate reductase
MSQPNWGPIGQQVYDRTYSRTMEDGSKEQWSDTVKRVVTGNTALGDQSRLWMNERGLLTRLIANFDIIPAGRHLWVSGVPGRQFLFNCHRAGWTENLADHFGFVFDELMKGGGIGSNYSDDYMRRAPLKFYPAFNLRIVCDESHSDVHEVNPDVNLGGYALVVEDSREGWVEALKAIVNAHQHGSPAQVLTIDVSKVRPRGSAIRGFGGTASGPGPLADMLRSVHNTLSSQRGNYHLSWKAAMEIDHHISRCVIAGNVRRSARMSIKLWSDPDIIDFIRVKSDTGEHWTTNISVEFDEEWFAGGKDSSHGRMVQSEIAKAALRNGEPGLFNSALAADGESGDVRCTNPCGEIALEEWENCNLGHINIGQIKAEDLEPALRAMARFLIRATYSDIDNPLQRSVVDRNRRIGVGLFGFQEWVIRNHGMKYSKAWKSDDIAIQLRWMKSIVRQEAKSYSAELGIPEPIKVTTVAPTGTIAKMPGATEGIHPIYAKHFIRRVRYADTDPSLNHLDPSVKLEPCIYSDATTVASFVCADEIFLKVPERLHHLVESVDEIDIHDMIAVQEMVQRTWADNAVSFTVNFPDGAYTDEDMEDAMFSRLASLKGTTVMPDGTRPQAPYERISEDEFFAMNTHAEWGSAMDECATGACPIK